jgi:hypothetical protein
MDMPRVLEMLVVLRLMYILKCHPIGLIIWFSVSIPSLLFAEKFQPLIAQSVPCGPRTTGMVIWIRPDAA